ncbi:CTDSPL2 [Symbiodinium sp. CCMP2592]|nr:CTDSPL2 [Symbiodinium sp. CCMP2592]
MSPSDRAACKPLSLTIWNTDQNGWFLRRVFRELAQQLELASASAYPRARFVAVCPLLTAAGTMVGAAMARVSRVAANAASLDFGRRRASTAFAARPLCTGTCSYFARIYYTDDSGRKYLDLWLLQGMPSPSTPEFSPHLHQANLTQNLQDASPMVALAAEARRNQIIGELGAFVKWKLQPVRMMQCDLMRRMKGHESGDPDEDEVGRDYVIIGAWIFSGMTGVTNSVDRYSQLTKYLISFMKSRGLKADPYGLSRGMDFLRFVEKVWQVDNRSASRLREGKKFTEAQPWTGDRWTITAYTIRDVDGLSWEQSKSLMSLGFQLNSGRRLPFVPSLITGDSDEELTMFDFAKKQKAEGEKTKEHFDEAGELKNAEDQPPPPPAEAVAEEKGIAPYEYVEPSVAASSVVDGEAEHPHGSGGPIRLTPEQLPDVSGRMGYFRFREMECISLGKTLSWHLRGHAKDKGFHTVEFDEEQAADIGETLKILGKQWSRLTVMTIIDLQGRFELQATRRLAAEPTDTLPRSGPFKAATRVFWCLTVWAFDDNWVPSYTDKSLNTPVFGERGHQELVDANAFHGYYYNFIVAGLGYRNFSTWTDAAKACKDVHDLDFYPMSAYGLDVRIPEGHALQGSESLYKMVVHVHVAPKHRHHKCNDECRSNVDGAICCFKCEDRLEAHSDVSMALENVRAKRVAARKSEPIDYRALQPRGVVVNANRATGHKKERRSRTVMERQSRDPFMAYNNARFGISISGLKQSMIFAPMRIANPPRSRQMIEDRTGLDGAAKVSWSFPPEGEDLTLTNRCYVAFVDRFYKLDEAALLAFGVHHNGFAWIVGFFQDEIQYTVERGEQVPELVLPAGEELCIPEGLSSLGDRQLNELLINTKFARDLPGAKNVNERFGYAFRAGAAACDFDLCDRCYEARPVAERGPAAKPMTVNAELIPGYWDMEVMEDIAMLKGLAPEEENVLNKFGKVELTESELVYTRDRKGTKVPDRLQVMHAYRIQNLQNWTEFVRKQRRIREEIDALRVSGNKGVCRNGPEPSWRLRHSSSLGVSAVMCFLALYHVQDARSVSGHELSPLGTSKDNGWACDGRDEDAGCASKITGFRQTKGMNRSNLRLSNLSGLISLLESLVILSSLPSLLRLPM